MILQEFSQSPTQHLNKIRFLQSQKQQQQDHIKSLEYSLQLNKTAMKQFTNLLNDKYKHDQEILILLKSISQLQTEKNIIMQQNIHLKQQVQSQKCQIFINSQINSYQKLLAKNTITSQNNSRQGIFNSIEINIEKVENEYSDVFPRHDLVSMQIKAEQTMKLAKILINQNNKLYNQIKCICQDLEQTNINLCDIQTLSKNNDKILGLRTKIQKIKNYFNNLQEKRQLLKCNTEIIDKPSNVNNKQNISNQQNRKHNNQQIVSSLRQLLFKQKKNNQILTQQLQQYSIKIKQLKTTNKLLTQSNINYQGKRAIIKQELLLYKNKYAELMNIILKTRNNTLSNTKIILKQLRKEQQQCKQSNNQPFSFKKQKKQNIQLHVSKQQSTKQWSNSLFRHIKPSKIKRSLSCILNDVFVDQIDSYQKQEQTQVNISNLVIQQSFNEPFSINYSVIHPN